MCLIAALKSWQFLKSTNICTNIFVPPFLSYFLNDRESLVFAAQLSPIVFAPARQSDVALSSPLVGIDEQLRQPPPSLFRRSLSLSLSVPTLLPHCLGTTLFHSSLVRKRTANQGGPMIKFKYVWSYSSWTERERERWNRLMGGCSSYSSIPTDTI